MTSLRDIFFYYLPFSVAHTQPYQRRLLFCAAQTVCVQSVRNPSHPLLSSPLSPTPKPHDPLVSDSSTKPASLDSSPPQKCQLRQVLGLAKPMRHWERLCLTLISTVTIYLPRLRPRARGTGENTHWRRSWYTRTARTSMAPRVFPSINPRRSSRALQAEALSTITPDLVTLHERILSVILPRS